jgi:hypothetical protein
MYITMHRGAPVLFLACTLLAACQTRVPPALKAAATVVMEERQAWVDVAAPEDAGRIQRLASAWTEGLAEARRKGFTRQLRAEGALLDPNSALPRAAPPPGSYNCRLIKIGDPAPRARAFVANKPFFCYVGVNDDQLSITKQTGSQRPGGYLWETGDSRKLIFLGSVALGTEDAPLSYGENSARNMAGVFERYGNLRYRLVVPWPRDGSKLDIFELIPTSEQPD